MVKSLDRKWKELLYAFSGFGPNFMMVAMGAYFTDAINPAALSAGSYQAITGTCLIVPAIFPILWMIAKAFDGIIDIPFASITDTLSTKWGRRRPTIAICTIPMIISYILCWTPVGGDNRVVNTIWIFFWALVFFATYTMCLITFYGSLSSVCHDEGQRMRVSSFKAFFDTISYCVTYALVPLVIDLAHIRINKFILLCVPVMLTITIPLFLIKEGEKYGYPENNGQKEKEEKVRIGESLKLTFGNKVFVRWLAVNGCSYFGLQMFLVGMNAMIIGGMGFNGAEMAIINTCAFAPVPIMIYLFNKLKARKGLRFTYQTCLLAFAIAIFSFDVASLYFLGPNKKMLQYIIGGAGGVFASWAISSFFLMPCVVPSQIAAVEEKITGKRHSAMYFAAQAVVTSVIGAVAASLVYENIKMLFISKAAKGVVYASNFADAAGKFGVAENEVFNLGTLLVPVIVCVFCVAGFVLAFKMPKNYDTKELAKEFKRHNPDLDVSEFVKEEEIEKTGSGEIVFVQIALSILSGFIFGFIWIGIIAGYVKKLTGKDKRVLYWILSCLLPFASIVVNIKMHKALKEKADALGIKLMGNNVLYIISGIILPVAPVNIVGMSVMQRDINKLLGADNE